MNLYALLPIITFLINGFVWTYIFAQKKQDKINKAFLIYSADLELWLLITILSRMDVPETSLLLILKTGSVFWLSITFWFLNFSYTFINKRRDVIYYFFAMLSVIAILISCTTNYIISDYEIVFWGVDEVQGVLMLPVVFCVIFVPGIYALLLIKNASNNYVNPNIKSSLKLLYTGSAIILFLGLVSNIILPYIFNFKEFVQIAESATVIQSIFVFAAVKKYKLFSIGIEDAAQYLFEKMYDPVIIVDQSGFITQINNSAQKIFKFNTSERSKKIEEIIPGFHQINSLQDSEKEISIKGQFRTFQISRTDISEGSTGLGSLFILRDVTDKKNYVETIRQSRMILQQAEQLAHLGSWEWDIKKNKVTWSDELFRIYGLESNSFGATFEAYLSLVHPDDKEYVQEMILRSLKDGSSAKFYERIIRPSGEVRFLYSKGIVNSDENGNPLNMVGACLDITEFKKVENELRISREQLRALSASLQSAREEERMHIAREIHDELGQLLTAIKIDINMLCDEIENNEQNNVNIIKNLKEIEAVTDKLIQSVRNIATELRPEILDHLGLFAAIEWQVNEFTKRTGLVCNLNSSLHYIDMKQEHAIAVFRILQEALTNVIRHSNATAVEISLMRNDDDLILVVFDNGKGISEDEKSHIKSIGIIGMQERGIILGGEVSISGIPGKGTTVTLKLPFFNQAHSASDYKPGLNISRN